MSFAALAGGDSCGPANPMAQLSKLYGQDRGVQQDHFNPAAGPSSSRFRQQPQQNSNHLDQSAQQFFSPTAQHRAPLDLSELTRALPSSSGPSSHAATPPPPAWASAFAASELQQHRPSPVNHPSFQQAFQSGAQREQWAGDFDRHQQQQQLAQAKQVAGPGTAEAQQMAGMGMQSGMQRMGMMGLQRPMAPMGQLSWQENSQIAHLDPNKAATASQATDWETAFLAQEASHVSATATADQTSTGYSSEQLTRSTTPPARAESPRTQSRARDALAETAAALLSSVQRGEQQAPTESGSKMAQSTFLELMRKLRDGEVEVQGDRVVEQIEPVIQVDRKGKGKAVDRPASPLQRKASIKRRNSTATATARALQGDASAIEQFAKAQHDYAVQQSMQRQDVRDALEQSYYGESSPSLHGMGLGDLWVEEDKVREQREEQSKPRERHVQFQGDGGTLMEDMSMDERTEEMMKMDTRVLGAGSGWEEDMDDFGAEMIAGGHARQAPKAFVPSAQQREWHALQDDWEQFEATATGFKPAQSSSTAFSSASIIGGYRFAAENPYVQSTRTHQLHAATMQPALSTYDSVLQHEAAVQRDPQSAPAWLALGIKQQENERESLAISALQQATALDPTLGEAHLALAISYTNENERALAYEAVEKWVNTLSNKYPGVVEAFKRSSGELAARETLEGQHTWLTELLIELARRGGEEVDAEVQVGLGVLFNASEEYDKAGDCFEAALAVRPDDPLLYNRIGATYANSGKTALAMEYYNEAVELRPGYVRARFNLAVANLNLGQYDLAAQHLMTALEIQQEESERDEQSQKDAGTSQALWDSLRTCLLMIQRSDLSHFAVERDLGAIRAALEVV